jgi:hypothetical protein
MGSDRIVSNVDFFYPIESLCDKELENGFHIFHRFMWLPENGIGRRKRW